MTTFRFWSRKTDNEYVESVRTHRAGWGRKVLIAGAVFGAILWIVIVAYGNYVVSQLMDMVCSSIETGGQLDSEIVQEVVRPWMWIVAGVGGLVGGSIVMLPSCISLVMSSVWDRKSRLLVQYYDLALKNVLRENEPGMTQL